MIQYFTITNQASIYGETTSTDKVKLLRAAWSFWNEKGSRLDCKVHGWALQPAQQSSPALLLGRAWPFSDI